MMFRGMVPVLVILHAAWLRRFNGQQTAVVVEMPDLLSLTRDYKGNAKLMQFLSPLPLGQFKMTNGGNVTAMGGNPSVPRPGDAYLADFRTSPAGLDDAVAATQYTRRDPKYGGPNSRYMFPRKFFRELVEEHSLPVILSGLAPQLAAPTCQTDLWKAPASKAAIPIIIRDMATGWVKIMFLFNPWPVATIESVLDADGAEVLEDLSHADCVTYDFSHSAALRTDGRDRSRLRPSATTSTPWSRW